MSEGKKHRWHDDRKTTTVGCVLITFMRRNTKKIKNKKIKEENKKIKRRGSSVNGRQIQIPLKARRQGGGVVRKQAPEISALPV